MVSELPVWTDDSDPKPQGNSDLGNLVTSLARGRHEDVVLKTWIRRMQLRCKQGLKKGKKIKIAA